VSHLQPLTFVFILIIVFCIGWCCALWWVDRQDRKRRR
jgi:hypothetical protein